jgi:polyisoprenoid-binding protein YceI
MLRWLVLMVLGLAAATAAPALAAQWRVDPTKSRIAVQFDQGGKPIEARFESFQAEVTFDPKDLAAARVVITVDLASFRSGDAQRDQMATAGEFLAAGAAGTARYVTRNLKAMGGDRYEVAAELALKGATKSLTHPATITIKGDEAHAQGEAKLDRLAFGIGSGQFPRGDQVGLTVLVRFDLVAERAG